MWKALLFSPIYFFSVFLLFFFILIYVKVYLRFRSNMRTKTYVANRCSRSMRTSHAAAAASFTGFEWIYVCFNVLLPKQIFES